MQAIAAHSGDLEAAEAACADNVVDEENTSCTVPFSSSQRKGKRCQEDDQLLQSLQKRVHESGALLKGLAQPQPITATAAFANYVLIAWSACPSASSGRHILVVIGKRLRVRET